MGSCRCSSTKSSIAESTNPPLDDYKSALKNLGNAIKFAHKTEEGKKLSSDYWLDIVSLLKKAKLGISMMELGIDDEEEIKNTHDTTVKKVKPTPAGEKGAGGPQGNNPAPTDSTDESVNEKSSSKSQQRLFGMVHAYNKGELKKGDVNTDLYDKVKKIASGMTKTDAKDMAKTDHDDLPEVKPTDEFYDTMNHLGILLSEQNFDEVGGDGTEFNVVHESRNFNIKYSEKFYLVGDKYNFELGDATDLNEVVTTFSKLIKHTDYELIKDYELTLS